MDEDSARDAWLAANTDEPVLSECDCNTEGSGLSGGERRGGDGEVDPRWSIRREMSTITD